ERKCTQMGRGRRPPSQGAPGQGAAAEGRRVAALAGPPAPSPGGGRRAPAPREQARRVPRCTHIGQGNLSAASARAMGEHPGAGKTPRRPGGAGPGGPEAATTGRGGGAFPYGSTAGGEPVGWGGGREGKGGQKDPAGGAVTTAGVPRL